MGVRLNPGSETGLTLLAVFAGGALGGVLRYSLAAWVTRLAGNGFPWGTLVVNSSGSLALGILAGWLWSQALLAGDDPLALSGWALGVVGVLGSYTTVSAFSLQTVDLWQTGNHRAAFWNVVLSVGLTLALVGFGWWLGGLAGKVA